MLPVSCSSLISYIELFLGALFCRVLDLIFVQKGLISCMSRKWDIGYTEINVDDKNIDFGHVINSVCVVISDHVKFALETLPATNIGIFPNLFVLPNYFTKRWEDLVLSVGGGQVANLTVGVGIRWQHERRIRHA